jgi:hypothetical protein
MQHLTHGTGAIDADGVRRAIAAFLGEGRREALEIRNNIGGDLGRRGIEVNRCALNLEWHEFNHAGHGRRTPPWQSNDHASLTPAS